MEREISSSETEGSAPNAAPTPGCMESSRDRWEGMGADDVGDDAIAGVALGEGGRWWTQDGRRRKERRRVVCAAGGERCYQMGSASRR